MPRSRIALRAIAERAGISRMAVSLALRNHPSISAAQRRRVQSLAQRLGYRPNPTVAAIVARLRSTSYIESAGTIAVVGNQSVGGGRQSEPQFPSHGAAEFRRGLI